MGCTSIEKHKHPRTIQKEGTLDESTVPNLLVLTQSKYPSLLFLCQINLALTKALFFDAIAATVQLGQN